MPDFIPNSFQTPNDYVDKYMYLLTSAEYKVLTFVVRKIFGFNKRQDSIALSQFTDGLRSRVTGEMLNNGTGLTKPTVVKSLKELIKYGLIIEVSKGGTNHAANVYELQLDCTLVDIEGLKKRREKYLKGMDHRANLNKRTGKRCKPVLVKIVNKKRNNWSIPYTSTSKNCKHTISTANTHLKSTVNTARESAPESKPKNASPEMAWGSVAGWLSQQSRTNTQWIAGCTPIGWRGNVLVVGCLNSYTADLLTSRFKTAIDKHALSYTVEFVLRPQ